ncbi:MAG TPA: Hpt domain-containing protein [Burkholderiaceae bacterium]|jgi:HPt (histidine-containing phosphotransfer) domain-containing protein|nr:Hpt domain-containing protein [Burkholderiaceae bacterium]
MNANSSSPSLLELGRALEFVGEEDQIDTMLGMLRDSLETDIPAIDQCIAGGDVRGANRLLHPLKGFMPVFCVVTLVDKLFLAEKISKGDDLASLRDAWAALRPDLVALKAEIEARQGKA